MEEGGCTQEGMILYEVVQSQKELDDWLFPKGLCDLYASVYDEPPEHLVWEPRDIIPTFISCLEHGRIVVAHTYIKVMFCSSPPLPQQLKVKNCYRKIVRHSWWGLWQQFL